MDLKKIANDTAKTLISYVTYQALRTVIAQLDETEPKRAYWLRQFSYRVSIQDGEAFLKALFQEEQRLAFRILTVREHIADEIADYLPELLRTGIQAANLTQRTQQLERMTQVDPQIEADLAPESIAPELNSTEAIAEPPSNSTTERLPPESLW